MKTLWKNLGIIIMLIGVCVFVVYHFALTGEHNILLYTGLGLVILGCIAQIILNKFIE